MLESWEGVKISLRRRQSNTEVARVLLSVVTFG